MSYRKLLWVLLAASPLIAQDRDSVIFPSGAVPERLFSGGEFTEGPAMGPDGCVYFSDLTWDDTSGARDGHIWRFDPSSGSCAIFRSPSGMSNGIKFDCQGGMVVAVGSDFGGRGLIRLDLRSGKGAIVVSSYLGKPLNSPNDLTIDSRRRIYFTDPRYGDRTSAVQPVHGVYRLEPGGRLRLLSGAVSMPNGIALSPDETTLFVGCYDEGEQGADGSAERAPRMQLLSFSLATGDTLSLCRVLVDFGTRRGPDGIAVDAAGHLYVAVRDEQAPCVEVYQRDGTLLSRIGLDEVPSNVAFARPPDDQFLYITAGKSLYRVRTTQRGWFPDRWTSGANKK